MQREAGDQSGFCQELLLLGRWHAAQRGLTGEEQEDCALEFTLRMLCLLHDSDSAARAADVTPIKLAPAFADPSWLHRRARTHARNFHRAVVHHARRCVPIDHAGEAKGVGQEEEPERSPSGGEAALLRAEFWDHILSALDSLDPVPRQLVIGHHLHGQSIAVLARSCGRTPHAVEQTLLRARQRMCQVLEQRDCGEAVLSEYCASFSPSATSVPPAPLSRRQAAK